MTQAGWVGAFRDARAAAVSKCTSVIRLACNVPRLTAVRLGEVIALTAGGVMGYAARCTPMRFEDTEEIERERRRAYFVHIAVRQ